MTAVTPTDRPKLVRNSCVFGGVFMLSRCFLDCSVGVGVFVTGLSQISSFFSCIYVFYTYMYIWSSERAANIHTYANLSFPLILSEIGSKIKYFCVKSKKYFHHSHFKTNTALRMKFHAHYIFTKILIFIYNNAQIHPNVTVQYLKSIPFVQKA